VKAHIAIVGAGIAGAATAFHLRRLGVGPVILIEKESSPGQHATGRNAAILRQRVADPELRPLMAGGANAIRGGQYCRFHKTGGVVLPNGDATDRPLTEASDYFPPATGRGLWCADDGVIDVAGLLETYLRGQHVLCDTIVSGWTSDSVNGLCLRTSAGEINTDVLVNAAGPWAGQIGQLPLTPKNRHLFTTPPIDGVDRDWPYVWDDHHGLYFRPESGGLLLCPCDEDDRKPGDYRIDHDIQIRLAHLLASSQPQLASVRIRRVWTGQRTFAADRRFVIGWDARYQGVFHVAGLGGHGVTASYAVGELAATMIAAGPRADVSNPFDPGRLPEARQQFFANPRSASIEQ